MSGKGLSRTKEELRLGCRIRDCMRGLGCSIQLECGIIREEKHALHLKKILCISLTVCQTACRRAKTSTQRSRVRPCILPRRTILLIGVIHDESIARPKSEAVAPGSFEILLLVDVEMRRRNLG